MKAPTVSADFEDHVIRIGFGLLSMPDLETALEILSACLRQTARS